MSSQEQNAQEVEFLPPKERKGTRRALVVIAVILAVILALAIAAAAWLTSKLGEIQTLDDPFENIPALEGVDSRPTHDPEPETDSPVNVLMLGTDSRISAGDPSEWVQGAQRTDAFMILQISGDRESINVMSIPRDAWVYIPGYGNQKINAAFSYGGPTLTIATVEQLTGIPIDHIAVVDFTSFAALTDALGGVEMTSLNEGTKTYNGEEALTFVRQRKGLPGGDFDRVRRQQMWMQSVISQTLTRDNLTNPARALELYNTVSPYIAVDDGFGLGTVIDLAPDVARIGSEDMNFVTAPNDGTGTSSDGQSIVILDQDEFDALTDAFAEDRAAEYINENADSLRTLDSGGVY